MGRTKREWQDTNVTFPSCALYLHFACDNFPFIEWQDTNVTFPTCACMMIFHSLSKFQNPQEIKINIDKFAFNSVNFAMLLTTKWKWIGGDKNLSVVMTLTTSHHNCFPWQRSDNCRSQLSARSRVVFYKKCVPQGMHCHRHCLVLTLLSLANIRRLSIQAVFYIKCVPLGMWCILWIVSVLHWNVSWVLKVYCNLQDTPWANFKRHGTINRHLCPKWN